MAVLLTQKLDVHWVWPELAGILFGMGNCGVFIYAGNYLVHSYNIYAASALAGNAMLRSIMGAVLPIAGPPLYAKLGAHWAGTLLGLLEVVIIPIPVLFYFYGDRIRGKSALIRSMREDLRRMEGRQAAAQAKKRKDSVADLEKRADAEASIGTVMQPGALLAEQVDHEMAEKVVTR